MLDKELVECEVKKYSRDDLPPYFPDRGIWFNHADVNHRSIVDEAMNDEEAEQELNKLEKEVADSKKKEPEKRKKQ